MKKKNIIIIVVAVLGIILLIGGGSYAFFNYYQVSNISNVLIAGDIRMNIQEGSDTITLTNVFPETKEEARSHDGNTLTFTLSGANTSSKAIGYNILLNDGTSKAGKTRFLPNELRFDLVEIIDNNEVYLVENANYNTLSDTSIYDNVVPGNTNSVSHTYKIRVWVDENVIISETETGNHVYTPSEYKNLYATVKIAVKGETQDGNMYTVTFDADGGSIPINTKSIVVGQDYGYLPTPTKEGYTFLGWNGKNLLNLNVEQGTIDNTNVSDETKRLFEANKFVVGLAFNNYYSPTAVNSFSHNANGVTVESRSGYGIAYTFISDANSNYSVSYNAASSKDEKNDTRVTIMFYKNDGSYIGKYDKTGCGSLNFQYYTPTDTYFMLINFANNNAIGTSSFSKIQLEEGNTATEYEPYFVTSDVKVTQEKNHTLKAIWKANS